MFQRLCVILTIGVVALFSVMLVATGEEFAEKLLPLLFGVVILFYLAASWYLGYFIATQKPSIDLIIFGLAAIIISFLSGFFIGRK